MARMKYLCPEGTDLVLRTLYDWLYVGRRPVPNAVYAKEHPGARCQPEPREYVPLYLIWAELGDRSWKDLYAKVRQLCRGGLIEHVGTRDVVGAWELPGGGEVEVVAVTGPEHPLTNPKAFRVYVTRGQERRFLYGAVPAATPCYDLTPAGFAAVNRMRVPQKTANAPKRRGRPVDTDRTQDKRIADAWASGAYRTYADLAAAFTMKEDEVRHALDRHRQREKRKVCNTK